MAIAFRADGCKFGIKLFLLKIADGRNYAMQYTETFNIDRQEMAKWKILFITSLALAIKDLPGRNSLQFTSSRYLTSQLTHGFKGFARLTVIHSRRK